MPCVPNKTFCAEYFSTRVRWYPESRTETELARSRARVAQNGTSNIEFLGYVPEDAIPELFSTASVLVMPYNSATGASGPAHQACEYGVPIVCADIPDFGTMAADEEMAVCFYKTGNPRDLADKLVEVLQSAERQHQMAEQNFSAAVRMTMPSVVRHYLRWFELARCKQAIASRTEVSSFRRWLRGQHPSAMFHHSITPPAREKGNGDGASGVRHEAPDPVSGDAAIYEKTLDPI